MAHFRGTVKERGRSFALGATVGSKLTVRAASWQGAIETTLYFCDGQDYARVTMTPRRGAGRYLVLYDGPVSGSGQSAAKAFLDTRDEATLAADTA